MPNWIQQSYGSLIHQMEENGGYVLDNLESEDNSSPICSGHRIGRRRELFSSTPVSAQGIEEREGPHNRPHRTCNQRASIRNFEPRPRLDVMSTIEPTYF